MIGESFMSNWDNDSAHDCCNTSKKIIREDNPDEVMNMHYGSCIALQSTGKTKKKCDYWKTKEKQLKTEHWAQWQRTANRIQERQAQQHIITFIL